MTDLHKAIRVIHNDTVIINGDTQSNIQAISQDLNYWISIWGKQTYVLAKVVEINENLF